MVPFQFCKIVVQNCCSRLRSTPNGNTPQQQYYSPLKIDHQRPQDRRILTFHPILFHFFKYSQTSEPQTQYDRLQSSKLQALPLFQFFQELEIPGNDHTVYFHNYSTTFDVKEIGLNTSNWVRV